MKTEILSVDENNVGSVTAKSIPEDVLDELSINLDMSSISARNLYQAAQSLKTSDVPVAFPTETVYGLGADATRSNAVRGIYKAKQRPSDNPLIVHFASLKQLRDLLNASATSDASITTDPIPAIYGPLISRFWPGPLTIILPNPVDSLLAPEVTAGLATFGARIPRHVLALALIQLAGVPVAAPSANASTKPSPTAAEHVAHDLDGRIETIIDGGPCDVGVESTVVDGLSNPPLVLRPGGISMEQIRRCPGWENTQIGYKNTSEKDSQPKAPGMKYRHYSPKATVVLYEASRSAPSLKDVCRQSRSGLNIGIIRTKTWSINTSLPDLVIRKTITPRNELDGRDSSIKSQAPSLGFAGMLQTLRDANKRTSKLERFDVPDDSGTIHISDICLGADTADIARGIFSALRDLDRHDVCTIFVEGIEDSEGDTAAAVMNRLRKAAEIRIDG